MLNDQADNLPNLESAATPWLARNRKLAILVGAVVVIGGVAVWTAIRRPSTSTSTNQPKNQNSATTSTGTNRPTFQRATVANTSSALPPSYTPPTTADLTNAIQQQQAIKK